jgi:hypothetical protein
VNFFAEWFMEWIRGLLMFIGFVTVVMFVAKYADHRVRRREWLSEVTEYRSSKGSLTRLHGAACRCVLCCIEGKGDSKGKGGRGA